ncbi:helix-turn-helix transcriptional regulator [Lachnospiraceae bacterium MD329]|nr:helix-turn-helix transcriptional regulator [Lachnospiraceae bacterium MD329]
MAIGNRIKLFRNMRNLTQKELGAKVGFPFNATDVRIAQYESEKRIPKDDMVNKLASTLDVSPAAIKVPDIDTDIGLMHTLFALEDTRPFRISKIDDTICISLDKHDRSYISMLDMLSLWYDEYEKLQNGEISKEEYDQWRYTYPKMQVERFKQDIDKLRKAKKQQSE